MSYKVNYKRSAEKFLDRQPQDGRKRIMDAISKLPFSGDVQPMNGRAGFRLRVGTYRVIFEVDAAARVVTVWDIGARGDVYKK
jgi:mRNA interferase RelE/StbE